MSDSKQQIIVLYMPVFHQGYLEFFERHPEARTVWLVDRSEFFTEFPELRKDIRALSPSLLQKMLRALPQFADVELFHRAAPASELPPVDGAKRHVILPDEDLSIFIAEHFFANDTVELDHYFLRWDKRRTMIDEQVEADAEVTTEALHRQMLGRATELSQKSLDWWRQVAAVAVRDGVVIAEEKNQYVPSPQQAYADGDPRGNFHSGEHFELSISLHAEAAVIARAAASGMSVTGCDFYTTTFPCPTCAKLLAASGVRAVYFRDGYARVDGQHVLKTGGVKILRVVS